MSRRRVALSVPASRADRISKAAASAADEIVVDLEDAVAPEQKPSARENLAGLSRRSHGVVAVRINGTTTPWFDDDLAAAVASPAVDSIVVPKAESPEAMIQLAAQIDALELSVGRASPLTLQALIESPVGVLNIAAIAAGPRIEALIIGYADLSASMGRHIEADWSFAQDALVLAAKAAGVQAIDGPRLSTLDDDVLASAAQDAHRRGFDGKWVIHPQQIATVTDAFSPSDADIEKAREILATLDAAAAEGQGAARLGEQMLDEAVAVWARRTIEKSDPA